MTKLPKRKTTVLKPADVSRSWYVIDASQAPLGRVSVKIANLLIGKSKANYTPHVDSGDYVVVVNAANTVVTGQKEIQKKYYRHSQYPGSLKEVSLKLQLEKNPSAVIERAVKGMLPKNKLQSERLNRLKVYPGTDHLHTAQTPKFIEMSKTKQPKDRSSK